LHFGNEFFAIDAALIEQFGDFLVGIRVQIAERKVFQLPLDLPDAQPVGERRVKIGGFLRNAAAYRLGRFGDGVHGLRAPGEPD